VASETKVLVAVVVTSRLTPLDVISCSPSGKGLRKTQFPSDTACVTPAGAYNVISQFVIMMMRSHLLRVH
jgi:hypothetical protein